MATLRRTVPCPSQVVLRIRADLSLCAKTLDDALHDRRQAGPCPRVSSNSSSTLRLTARDNLVEVLHPLLSPLYERFSLCLVHELFECAHAAGSFESCATGTASQPHCGHVGALK
jgi:hypothetical protein